MVKFAKNVSTLGTMLPHPLYKRILSRVIFYAGVAAVALLLRIVPPDQQAADNAVQDATAAIGFDSEPAKAYFAYPGSQ